MNTDQITIKWVVLLDQLEIGLWSLGACKLQSPEHKRFKEKFLVSISFKYDINKSLFT